MFDRIFIPQRVKLFQPVMKIGFGGGGVMPGNELLRRDDFGEETIMVRFGYNFR